MEENTLKYSFSLPPNPRFHWFYARRDGYDQCLAVRRAIKHITYSKNKITLDWYYNRFSDDVEDLSLVGSGANAPAVKNFQLEAKTPIRLPEFVSLTPTFKLDTFRMVAGEKREQTIPLSFPNMAHKNWDNYPL